MKIEYIVSPKDYEDVLAMQLKLERQTFWAQFRFWALNVGFLAVTVVNLLFGTAFSPLVRVLFFLLAALFLIISGCRLYMTGLTAHLLLPHYLRRGIVDPAYLGKHVLTCHGNRLICRYGETVRKIPGSQISGVVTLKHCTAVLAEGKIFEIVPNLIWQENDISQQLNTMCSTVA